MRVLGNLDFQMFLDFIALNPSGEIPLRDSPTRCRVTVTTQGRTTFIKVSEQKRPVYEFIIEAQNGFRQRIFSMMSTNQQVPLTVDDESRLRISMTDKLVFKVLR